MHPLRIATSRVGFVVPVVVALLVVGGLVMLFGAPPLSSGAYIFAGAANGVDLVLHPQGYTGSGGVLPVEVCIDPTTLVPGGAAITDMEIPVQNNIAIWNQLQPIVGNSLLSSANNIPAGELDFESVALHELGHCIGLAHVNAASESGLPGNDANYTKATVGTNGVFNINPGADGVRGTLDDVRGDDISLHWFRTDTNDPGQLPLPVPVDATTYDRDASSLPAGHLYTQNLDRTAAGVMGHPSTFPINTEAVMQQGTFSDEDQRRLTADGVATILFGMSGADETAGSADDYTLNLSYGGISSAPSCDVSLSFTAMSGLAFCSVGGAFVTSPPGTTHARITTAFMEFGNSFNWFFNQEGPCRQTVDLPNGQWKQIALSCDPGLGNRSVTDVFDDDLAGTYDVNWVVYQRDALNDVYIKLGLADLLEVGRGYWIKTNLANQTVNIEGNFNGDGDIPLEEDATGRANMVGHRYWYNKAWADVQVDDGGVIKTLAQVDPAGACQGPNPVANGCIMSRVAHKWNGGAYEAFDGITPGMEGALENFDGLWVKSYKAGVELRIPDTRSTPVAPNTDQLLANSGGGSTVLASSASTPEIEVQGLLGEELRKTEQAARAPGSANNGWFVRIIATSGNQRDPGNVLGQLSDSVRGYDAHDLLELEPFGTEYLSVVFPHRDRKWKGELGDYTSDFHEPKTGKDDWQMIVKTPGAGRTVTLTWEGLPTILQRSRLFDRESRQWRRIRKGQSYTFQTVGPRHRLMWRVIPG